MCMEITDSSKEEKKGIRKSDQKHFQALQRLWQSNGEINKRILHRKERREQ